MKIYAWGYKEGSVYGKNSPIKFTLKYRQTTEAVVLGSNPPSLTLENSEDRQNHCVYCKISGQRGRPPPEAKKR